MSSGRSENHLLPLKLYLSMQAVSSSLALNKVQDLCGALLTSLVTKGLIMDLRIPKYQANDVALATEDEIEAGAGASEKTLSLLRSNTAESYTRVLAIVALVAELLAYGNTISQRDVYYSMKYLFKSQRECNASIIEAGLLLGLKRCEMNIVPTARGFLAGCIRFKFNARDAWTDGELAVSEGGVSVSSQWSSCSSNDLHVDTGYARCILVIEKQGIFHRLCEDNFHLRFPCILVTGCGFPDIATRAFVSRIATLYPDLPVLGLCDYNPYGLALLLTYKVGSSAKAFEGSGLQVAGFRWIGIRAHQLQHLQLPDIVYEPLSKHDMRKIDAMLRTETIHNHAAYKHELEEMKKGGRKCELEAVYVRGLHFFGEYIERLLLTHDYV